MPAYRFCRHFPRQCLAPRGAPLTPRLVRIALFLVPIPPPPSQPPPPHCKRPRLRSHPDVVAIPPTQRPDRGAPALCNTRPPKPSDLCSVRINGRDSQPLRVEGHSPAACEAAPHWTQSQAHASRGNAANPSEAKAIASPVCRLRLSSSSSFPSPNLLRSVNAQSASPSGAEMLVGNIGRKYLWNNLKLL